MKSVPPSEKPPLAAWPKCAFPGEGAHGWFQRLAVANGQISARTLAESMGLNGRDPQPAELLEFCLRFPFADRQNLIDATPALDERFVHLQGQTLRRGLDFSFSKPRVCSACVAEDRYYRSWFDIQALEHCPIHGLPLEGGAGTDRLAWWYPEVGVTPGGRDFAKSASIASEDRPWERYVLGRLRFMPEVLVPWLDVIALHEVIEMCVIMGRAVAGPHAPNGRSHAARAHLAPRGFELLRHGIDGLTRSLVTMGRDPAIRLLGPSGAFTRVFRDLSASSPNPIAEACQIATQKALHELGIHFRYTVRTPSDLPKDHLNLKEATAQLRLLPKQVRHLALRLGFAAPVTSYAQSYALSPSAVVQIREALDESIGHDQAAHRLGLSSRDFRELVQAGAIKPLIRMGGAVFTFDRFIPNDLEAALAKWRANATGALGLGISFGEFCARTRKTPGQVALQIASGERAVLRWVDDQPGFCGCVLRAEEAEHPVHRCRPRRPRSWNGVSYAEAAARLGTHAGSIGPLLAAGYLRALSGGPKQMSGICPESLERFGATYASARAYAALLEMTPVEVHVALRAAGVSRLSSPELTKLCFVRRDEVVERLGEEWDLNGSSAQWTAPFWTAFRDYLSEVGSANRLVGGVGRTAGLRPGDASIFAKVTICATPSAVDFAVFADRKLTPSRYERTMERLPLLRSTWPTATCVADPESGALKLSERFPCPVQPSQDQVRQIARQIDERLTALRYLLKSQPRLIAA